MQEERSRRDSEDGPEQMLHMSEVLDMLAMML